MSKITITDGWDVPPQIGGTLTVLTKHGLVELDVAPGESEESVARRAAAALNEQHRAPASTSRSLPLLDYLDQLEAIAKAATAGTWHRGADGTHVIADDFLMVRTTSCRDADHVIATQPVATLALIAKLRATEIASTPTNAWRAAAERPAEIINRFQDQVIDWAKIEVPA
jgi:hypothetical protein